MPTIKAIPQENTVSFSKPFHQNHFDSIQTLRGIAALLVVLEHIRYLNCGAFGVDIFFCISGFMILFTTHENTEHFLLKRILRIVPFYYLMTLGTYILLLFFPGMFAQTSANPIFLLKSLLFIPFDMGNGVLQPLMRIGWTVNYEMFFYLVFALSMRLCHKYRGLICSGILGLLVLSGYLLNGVLPDSPEIFALPAPFVFYSNPIILEFILGMLCYEIARIIYRICGQWQYTAKHKKSLGAVGLFCAFGLFVLLLVTKPTINILGLRRFLVWGIPGMLIVLSFFFAGLFLSMPSLWVTLGNISFSLYFVHYYPVLFMDRMICDFSAFSITALLGTIFIVILCVILAYIAWILIEKRFTGRLRRLFLPSLHQRRQEKT